MDDYLEFLEEILSKAKSRIQDESKSFFVQQMEDMEDKHQKLEDEIKDLKDGIELLKKENEELNQFKKEVDEVES